MAWSSPTNRTTGDIITAAIWNQDVVANPVALTPAGIAMLIDGSGTAITTGSKRPFFAPAKCDWTSVTLLADQSGSIVIDIWKDSYANWPPVDADSITSTTPPTITTATKSTDSTLSGWTKAVTADDIFLPNVDSCTTITWVVLLAKFARS